MVIKRATVNELKAFSAGFIARGGEPLDDLFHYWAGWELNFIASDNGWVRVVAYRSKLGRDGFVTYWDAPLLVGSFRAVK